MKRVLVASVAGLLLAGGSALAADIPRKSQAAPPVIQQLPMFTWTGFYAGLSGGYAFETGKSSLSGSPDLLATGLTPGAAKTLGDGFMIGATVGYNQQFGMFVAGLEADLSYVDLGRTVTSSNGGLTTTFSQDANYLGTVRGRLGVAFDRLLVYGTGGLAFGDQKASTNLAGLGAAWTGGKDAVRFGYVIGAGMEYAFTNNWSAKVEYLYYDLGKANYLSPQVAGAAVPGVFGDSRAEAKGNLVRAGLNYRF
jgi:outer membrane immunogenic protein